VKVYSKMGYWRWLFKAIRNMSSSVFVTLRIFMEGIIAGLMFGYAVVILVFSFSLYSVVESMGLFILSFLLISHTYYIFTTKALDEVRD